VRWAGGLAGGEGGRGGTGGMSVRVGPGWGVGAVWVVSTHSGFDGVVAELKVPARPHSPYD